MKRNFITIFIIVSILLVLKIVFIYNSKIARNQDDLINIVRKEFHLEQNHSANITYLGKFSKEDDALLWFMVQDESLIYYRAVECNLLPKDRYFVEEVYIPKIYSKDIVSVLWNTESIYLINDINCKSIVERNQYGDIISQIDILPNEYPYIFHNIINEKATNCSFLDSQGNDIK